MRMLGTRPERLTTIPYRAARPGGGTHNVQLSVEKLRVDRLPAGCDALLAAGDLQGIAPSPLGGEPGLLGIAVADYLSVWADSGLLPPADRVGALLTGDLYSAPDADMRGASGSVLDVWLAFVAAGCPMVIGVAGNHDEVTPPQVAELGSDVALLDGDRRAFGGITVAGVSGVVGDPSRVRRRTEADFLDRIEQATAPVPDVLLLPRRAGRNLDRPTGQCAGATTARTAGAGPHALRSRALGRAGGFPRGGPRRERGRTRADPRRLIRSCTSLVNSGDA